MSNRKTALLMAMATALPVPLRTLYAAQDGKWFSLYVGSERQRLSF